VQYGAVLRELGLDETQVGSVIDAVRPTDRSAKVASLRGGMPAFVIEAFETDDEGNRLRSLGMQDVTRAVVQSMCPGLSRAVREIEMPPRVYTLHNDLGDEARRVGSDGRLALPGFGEKLEEFIASVGGRFALRQFSDRLEEIAWLRVKLDHAEKELAKVRKARFETDLTTQVMVHVSHDSRDYAESARDAYDYWNWDEYTRKNPQPEFGADEERKAWFAIYDAWTAEHAPTFVFGTLPDPWAGVSAEDVREAAAEDELDVPNLLDSSLSDQYEGAYWHINDEEGLHDLLAEWLPHAGKGTAADLALEARLAAWNAKQVIVTYNPDFGTILPTREGGTHGDAIAWCERRISDLRAQIDDLSQWTPPPRHEVEATPKAA